MESSIFTQFIVPICLFVIMFGMGLSLTVSDFSRVVKYPAAVTVGLLGQMLLLPIVGFFIAYYLVDNVVVSLGVMLLAACPGGTTSNLVSYLAKGDVALSISLTAISSLLTIISIPIILLFSFELFTIESKTINLPVDRILSVLVLITIMPVMLGMLIRKHQAKLAFFLEPKLNKFSTLFLIVLVVLIIVRQQEAIFGALSEVWFATAALNLTTMLIAFCMALFLKLGAAQTTSLTVEVGIQNSALAILFATTILDFPEIALIPAIYSLVMYLTGGMLIFYRSCQSKFRD